jgi:hypothetical protein
VYEGEIEDAWVEERVVEWRMRHGEGVDIRCAGCEALATSSGTWPCRAIAIAATHRFT